MVAPSTLSPATKQILSGANRSGSGRKRPKKPSAEVAVETVKVKMAPPKRRGGHESSPTSEVRLPTGPGRVALLLVWSGFEKGLTNYLFRQILLARHPTCFGCRSQLLQ